MIDEKQRKAVEVLLNCVKERKVVVRLIVIELRSRDSEHDYQMALKKLHYFDIQMEETIEAASKSKGEKGCKELCRYVHLIRKGKHARKNGGPIVYWLKCKQVYPCLWNYLCMPGQSHQLLLKVFSISHGHATSGRTQA